MNTFFRMLLRSNLLLILKEDFDKLVAGIPNFRIFLDRYKEACYEAGQDRIMSNISFTAKEKYTNFIKLSPDVLSHIPLRI